jgi:ankyrin repeat protein
MRRRTQALALLAALMLLIAAFGAYYIYRTQYLPSELRVAATNGDLQRVQELLKAGVDVNLPLGLPSNSVLNRAIESGKPAVVEVVLKAGANPNAVGETGMSPLLIAGFFGNPEIIQLLIKHGARTDIVEERHKNTALLTAIRKGHADAVGVLIKAGADPNQGREWGDAPLCRAQSLGRTDIASMLAQAGATCP